jgi:hypothetical protein
VRQRQAEALGLERRLADLVNQAYGLTPEEETYFLNSPNCKKQNCSKR